MNKTKKRLKKIKEKSNKVLENSKAAIKEKIKVKHKTNIEKYMDTYIEKNTRKKKLSKNKKITITCIIIISCIFICIFRPIEKLRSSIYQRYEEYRVENAKIKAAREEEREKKNVITKSYEGKYPQPISGTITSNYGWRTLYGKREFHTGIDISGKHHDNVTTITDGVVTYAGSQRGYGNCVEVRHDTPNGTFYTFYAHLSKIYVSKWQAVVQGEILGLEGGAKSDPNPGYSTGHHLHFEVRTASGYGNHVNPYSYIF